MPAAKKKGEQIMNIFEKLSEIQAEIKVTKDNRNDFGGFNYRSAEDILEEAKPICKKHKTVLILSDSLLPAGDRYYITAHAKLVDTETEQAIEVTAFAREEETKKGMSAEQLSGSASSYARKYALSGLLNLDDNKDADTNAYTEVQEKAKKEEAKAKIKAQEDADLPLSKDEEEILVRLIKEAKGKDSFEDRVKKICTKYGVEDLADLKKSQYTLLVAQLNK